MSVARKFDGVNDALVNPVKSPVGDSSAITMAALVCPDGGNINSEQLAIELKSTFSNQDYIYLALGKKFVTTANFHIKQFLGGDVTVQVGSGWTPNQWYLIGGSRLGTSVAAVAATYHGGTVSRTTGFASRSFNPFVGQTSIGIQISGSSPFDGHIAWVAVWGRALFWSNEWQALASGAPPWGVRTDDLRACWPCWGNISNEQDLVGMNIKLSVLNGASDDKGAPTPFGHINQNLGTGFYG